MKNVFDFFVYCLPVAFILLSRKYMLKYKKLEGSGKIPDIITAQNRQTFYFVLSLLSALIIFIFI